MRQWPHAKEALRKHRQTDRYREVSQAYHQLLMNDKARWDLKKERSRLFSQRPEVQKRRQERVQLKKDASAISGSSNLDTSSEESDSGTCCTKQCYEIV